MRPPASFFSENLALATHQVDVLVVRLSYKFQLFAKTGLSPNGKLDACLHGS
jgi:hypothetical protein